MDQSKIKKIIFYFFIFIAVLVVLLALFFGSGAINWRGLLNRETSQSDSGVEGDKFAEDTFFDVTESVNEESVPASNEKNLLESENYKIKQITFGGSAVAAADNTKDLAVEIANLESEGLLSQDNQEAKLLISWETNKEVLSTVEYSLNDGQNAKKAVEGKYGVAHRLILSGLDPGAVYLYRIKSRDRWGREFVSEYFSVFSGSPAVSVFDLISKSMNELFGWAIKK